MSRDIEQASELLDVTNETELEAFLRRLVDDCGSRVGRQARPLTAHER